MFYAVYMKQFARSGQFCGLATLVSDFLEKQGAVTVPQLPYSPELAQADYFKSNVTTDAYSSYVAMLSLEFRTLTR